MPCSASISTRQWAEVSRLSSPASTRTFPVSPAGRGDATRSTTSALVVPIIRRLASMRPWRRERDSEPMRDASRSEGLAGLIHRRRADGARPSWESLHPESAAGAEGADPATIAPPNKILAGARAGLLVAASCAADGYLLVASSL